MHASSRRDDDDETDLEAREAPSAGQHVEAVLQREVAQAAERSTDGESRDVKEIAHELRQHAIEEISQSERREQARRRLARVYQFIDYFFFIAYALIGLLIALELLGARDRSGFMRFMHTVTAPLVAPLGRDARPVDRQFSVDGVVRDRPRRVSAAAQRNQAALRHSCAKAAG